MPEISPIWGFGSIPFETRCLCDHEFSTQVVIDRVVCTTGSVCFPAVFGASEGHVAVELWSSAFHRWWCDRFCPVPLVLGINCWHWTTAPQAIFPRVQFEVIPFYSQLTSTKQLAGLSAFRHLFILPACDG